MRRDLPFKVDRNRRIFDRELARALRAEAEQGWTNAKRWFEEQLLGPDF